MFLVVCLGLKTRFLFVNYKGLRAVFVDFRIPFFAKIKSCGRVVRLGSIAIDPRLVYPLPRVR